MNVTADNRHNDRGMKNPSVHKVIFGALTHGNTPWGARGKI